MLSTVSVYLLAQSVACMTELKSSAKVEAVAGLTAVSNTVRTASGTQSNTSRRTEKKKKRRRRREDGKN